MKKCKVCFAEFAGLASHYTKQIASGQNPSIDGAVFATAALENEYLLKKCISCYKKNMAVLNLPSETEAALTAHHEKCHVIVKEMFDDQVMVVESETDFGKQLSVNKTEVKLFSDSYGKSFILQK